MKGIWKHLLLLWVIYFLGACAPALPTGQPTDFTANSNPTFSDLGGEAQPTDGTVGSKPESENMFCEILEQFDFVGEPHTLQTLPIVKNLPLDPQWHEFGYLYWKGDVEEGGEALPLCQSCVGSVLRIIDLGRFPQVELNHGDEAALWFRNLFDRQNVDEVYGPEVRYQDFPITDTHGITLQDFPFELDGHYLFYILQDSPDEFSNRGEESLTLKSFEAKEEFLANLERGPCGPKGLLRSLRLAPPILIKFPANGLRIKI